MRETHTTHTHTHTHTRLQNAVNNLSRTLDGVEEGLLVALQHREAFVGHEPDEPGARGGPDDVDLLVDELEEKDRRVGVEQSVQLYAAHTRARNT